MSEEGGGGGRERREGDKEYIISLLFKIEWLYGPFIIVLGDMVLKQSNFAERALIDSGYFQK